jgi:phage terminase large subunit
MHGGPEGSPAYKPVALNKRAAVVWHRRAGKDLFSINFIAEQMVARPGTYWHCLPTYSQGRKIVWDEIRRFKQPFPKEIVAKTNEKEMQVEFVGTEEVPGSIYQVVGTDDIDRLVGGNPVGIVFSEYSLSDPAAWHLMQPVLRENKGWAMFIYTPRGHNHGYTLAQKARRSQETDKRWFFQQLTCLDTIHDHKRVCTEEDIQLDRDDGMPEELVKQEYFGSWDTPLVGAYYSKEMQEAETQNRLLNIGYEKKLMVNTYWDLGVDDSTCIWFVQRYGLEYRMIDFYEAHGEGLPHYARILKERKYLYDQHWAPHDISVKELGTGKTRLEIARGLGIKFRIAKKLPIADGIEASRSILGRCWFDLVKTEHGIDALRSYQKTYDEKKEVYSSTPFHNWASHPADAFRTFAVAEHTPKDSKFRDKDSLTNSGVSSYDPNVY